MKMFIPLVFILMACNNNKLNQPKKSENEKTVEGFKNVITRFSLPFSIPLDCDSNSIIFVKEVPFDTSYLLHIVKYSSQDIKGVYYQVLPSNHTDLSDFYGDVSREVIKFDGYSFKLTEDQWKFINNYTDNLVNKTKDIPRTISTCIHCPSYTIYYNHQHISSSSVNLRSLFVNYERSIVDSTIYNSIK